MPKSAVVMTEIGGEKAFVSEGSCEYWRGLEIIFRCLRKYLSEARLKSQLSEDAEPCPMWQAKFVDEQLSWDGGFGRSCESLPLKNYSPGVRPNIQRRPTLM